MHLIAAVPLVAMGTGGVIAIAVGVVVFFGAILAMTAARRTDVRGAGALSRETRKRDRDAEIDLPGERPTGREVERFATEQRSTELVPSTPQAPAVWVPPDPEVIGVSRRQFLNRAQVTLMTAGLGAFAAAGFTAFLWPTATGGFGGKVNIGKLDDINATIRSSRGFFYSATARSWVTIYPSEALPKARAVANYQPVIGIMEAGLTVLYQKCPHLGCRVPNCDSSQWFECPCHGSQYNRNGEKKGGPAPRGMDRFSATVSSSGDVTIDTGTVFPGPPIGTNTTGQEAEGPHCIGGGEHH